MKKHLPIYQQQKAADLCLDALRAALEYAKCAGAPKTVERIRLCISSAKGMQRNVGYRAIRETLDCVHTWSRRRDGSGCNKCGAVRFGEFITPVPPTAAELCAVLGPQWTICRNTPANRERYGKCITNKQYEAACTTVFANRAASNT